MDANEVLIEVFDRIGDHVQKAVEDVDPPLLVLPPEDGTNPIGWLVWHLTRVQDHHISELLEEEQLWVREPWPEQFGLAADPHNTGYGHDAAAVATVRPASGAALIGYYTAVAGRTRTYLEGLTVAALDRVVDRRWDPPVTLGVRLVSVVDDDIQHAAQAVYARGLIERRTARG